MLEPARAELGVLGLVEAHRRAPLVRRAGAEDPRADERGDEVPGALSHDRRSALAPARILGAARHRPRGLARAGRGCPRICGAIVILQASSAPPVRGRGRTRHAPYQRRFCRVGFAAARGGGGRRRARARGEAEDGRRARRAAVRAHAGAHREAQVDRRGADQVRPRRRPPRRQARAIRGAARRRSCSSAARRRRSPRPRSTRSATSRRRPPAPRSRCTSAIATVELRRAAVKALLKTKGPAAVKALRHALSDSDPMVRGIAATGLGTLKAKDAVPDLFVALDRKIAEAAASIGQLCAPSECEQLAGKLGRSPVRRRDRRARSDPLPPAGRRERRREDRRSSASSASSARRRRTSSCATCRRGGRKVGPRA